MKKTFPSASYAFRYRIAPASGNTINGLGERVRRRPRQIFHGSGRRQIEWQRLQTFFALTMPFRIYWQGLCNYWLLRKADGRVAKRCIQADPAAMADKIKAIAREAGAGGVGICGVTEHALYEDYDPGFGNAISIMMPMDVDEMRHIPEARAAMEVMRVYFAVSRVAIVVAAAVRAMGWRARAYGESADILHIPLAVAAGLGELGKHGSLISKEFGPNVRLATVLTDMPLAYDSSVDIGVEDLCLGCRRCTIDCPADAIIDQKQLVRGEQKWYVDFDKCVPYFTKTLGCGICIEVCPWTKPDRGESLSKKLLSKRATRTAHAAPTDVRQG